jgi:RNA polymerase sigma factor (sigma-70 family)
MSIKINPVSFLFIAEAFISQMITDDLLLHQIADGQESGLQMLYDRYSSLLYSIAFRITRDAGIAEEILQDTFFQLWRQHAQFDAARGSLIGWLLTITRHRAISHLREKSSQFTHESPWNEIANDLAEIGASQLQHHIRQELVFVALSQLSEVQQQAINLAYFEGLTFQEIATRIDAPLGTIKARVRTALQLMQKTLSASIAVGTRRSSASLKDILITDQLHSRLSRYHKAEGLSKSLQILKRVMTSAPKELLESFLQMPLNLCRAGTSGMSFLENGSDGAQIFRWTNLAGELKKHVGGTTPRNFSPCGVTLDFNSPQLFSYPGRFFHYFNNVDIPIVEGLVIPFHGGENAEGTVWIVSHQEGIGFDSDDVRIMTVLANFTASALRMIHSARSAPRIPS